MTDYGHDDRATAVNVWNVRTQALIGALAIMSSGFFLITLIQPAGLDPPPETAALFLVSVTAATVSYLLIAHGAVDVGYIAAILTGVYVIVSIGVVVSGVYGPSGPRTNPIGPIAWILLSLAVVVSGLYARQERRS